MRMRPLLIAALLLGLSAGVLAECSSWSTIDCSGGISIGTEIDGGTEGSVLFLGTGGAIDEDNSNFFRDNTNKRLGIGTLSPSYPLHVRKAASTYQLMLEDPTVGAVYSMGILFSIAGTESASIIFDNVATLGEKGTSGLMLYSSGEKMVTLESGNGVLFSTGIGSTGATLDITTNTVLAAGTDLTSADGSADIVKRQVSVVIDGGGSAITTGAKKAYVRAPYNMTISGWDVVADQSGSIVVDVWKDTYANFPPTVADTIAGSEKPTLSSAIKNQDAALSTWTTTVNAGDYLEFNVDSATTVTKVIVTIYGYTR